MLWRPEVLIEYNLSRVQYSVILQCLPRPGDPVHITIDIFLRTFFLGELNVLWLTWNWICNFIHLISKAFFSKVSTHSKDRCDFCSVGLFDFTFAQFYFCHSCRFHHILISAVCFTLFFQSTTPVHFAIFCLRLIHSFLLLSLSI